MGREMGQGNKLLKGERKWLKTGWKVQRREKEETKRREGGYL